MSDSLDEYRRNYEDDEVRKRPRSLLARGSRPEIIHYQDEDGTWRSRIKMSRIKFGDKEKEIFLEEFRKWGRMGEAAAAAGVSTACVRDHMSKDEDFAQAVLMADEEYTEKLIGHHQDLVFNGTVKKSYDRNGNLVSEERVYPIRLIELELKKRDEAYREKQEVKVNHTGGVLIAPAEIGSIDDWEARYKKAKDITPTAEDEEDPFALAAPEDEDD